MADLPEVIGLLHRADWTRLSLSAEVCFESGRAELLIAPGGHYRMEHQAEDGVVQGNDGQRGWTWWPSGRSEPSPAEVGLDDGRPVAVLFCPQDLLDGYVLEILGPVTACGRAAIAVTATPRAGDRHHEHVEAAVDAELGILLRREETFRGQLLAVTELTDVTVNPPAAPDPAGFTAPPRSRFREAPGEPFSRPDGAKANVMDLAMGGLGALSSTRRVSRAATRTPARPRRRCHHPTRTCSPPKTAHRLTTCCTCSTTPANPATCAAPTGAACR